MNYRFPAQPAKKPHARPIVPIAILTLATGLLPNAALAACSSVAGVRLQANAASICAAMGSYTGVGVVSGRGAVSSLTGGVVNAAAALTTPLAQNSVFGASAAGAGSQVNLQGGATISRAGATTGNGGLRAGTGGAITVNGPLSITLSNGSGNHGVLTEDSGTLVTLNGTVNITMGSGAAFAPGIRALTGSALIANGAVTINTAADNRSDAIAAATSATITLNGALNLTTSGVQASALKVTSAGRIIYSGPATLNISSINGSGIRAVTGGIVDANASSATSINVTGVNGQGISSRDAGSQVNLAGSTLINVSGATQADFPSGNLESYAAGVLADLGGAITATGALQINTTDATSYGALLAGSNATLVATGGGTVNAAGVAVGFLAGADQSARFDGFAISNTSGDLIQVNAATGSSALVLNNSTATAASGSRLLNVTNGSTFALTANRSTLTGNIVTDASSAVSLSLLNASSLTGAIDPVTLNIDGTSRWTMTGDSSLSGLTLAGRIDFQPPAAALVPKTLTVNGNWVGRGGTVRLNTSLGDSGSQTDRIVINGGAVSGNTLLQINNVGGLGGLTTGNGIEVVSAGSGATTTAQTTKDGFALSGSHVDAGAYEYRLYAADAQGAGENWYLRSATTVVPATPTAPTPTADTPASPTLPPVSVPTYRAEVPLFAALPAQLRQADLGMLGNLNRRIGDEAAAAPGDTGAMRRAWARAVYSDLDIRQAGVALAQSRGHVSGLQAGTDLLANGNWRAGVYVGTLDGSADVSGNARGITAKVGHNELQSRYLGGYATWMDASGLYADAVVQAGSHRYGVRPDGNPGASGKARSVTASIEVGQSFALAEGWRIEPQAQLIHQRTRFDDVQISGANVRQDADGGWIGRLGVRIKGDIATGAGLLQPYARANLYRTGRGADVAEFIGPAATTRIASASGYTSAELAGGFTLAVTPAASIYGEVGRLFSSGGDARVKSSVQGAVGLKVRW
ncbi:autotransporter outer membrane beta-barrel domain-containing protein [Variovorax sp. RT4R15]|uniref:autotransporter family protein n=1 Tax=Variovorax sp. RT4R15 TaxID=3443737 RepID=UPI003F45D2BA